MTRKDRLNQIEKKAVQVHQNLIRYNHSVVHNLQVAHFDEYPDGAIDFALDACPTVNLQPFNIYTKDQIRKWYNEDGESALEDYGGMLVKDCSDHDYYTTTQVDDSDYDLPDGCEDSGNTYSARPVSMDLAHKVVDHVASLYDYKFTKAEKIHITDDIVNTPRSRKLQDTLHDLHNWMRLWKSSSVPARIAFYLKMYPTATDKGVIEALHLNKRWQKLYPKAHKTVMKQGLNLTKDYQQYAHVVRSTKTLPVSKWASASIQANGLLAGACDSVKLQNNIIKLGYPKGDFIKDGDELYDIHANPKLLADNVYFSHVYKHYRNANRAKLNKATRKYRHQRAVYLKALRKNF